jgi:hypothetical protein
MIGSANRHACCKWSAATCRTSACMLPCMQRICAALASGVHVAVLRSHHACRCMCACEWRAAACCSAAAAHLGVPAVCGSSMCSPSVVHSLRAQFIRAQHSRTVLRNTLARLSSAVQQRSSLAHLSSAPQRCSRHPLRSSLTADATSLRRCMVCSPGTICMAHSTRRRPAACMCVTPQHVLCCRCMHVRDSTARAVLSLHACA